MSKFSLSQAEAAQAEAAKEICIKTVENFGESFTTAPDLGPRDQGDAQTAFDGAQPKHLHQTEETREKA